VGVLITARKASIVPLGHRQRRAAVLAHQGGTVQAKAFRVKFAPPVATVLRVPRPLKVPVHAKLVTSAPRALRSLSKQNAARASTAPPAHLRLKAPVCAQLDFIAQEAARLVQNAVLDHTARRAPLVSPASARVKADTIAQVEQIASRARLASTAPHRVILSRLGVARAMLVDTAPLAHPARKGRGRARLDTFVLLVHRCPSKMCATPVSIVLLAPRRRKEVDPVRRVGTAQAAAHLVSCATPAATAPQDLRPHRDLDHVRLDSTAGSARHWRNK
jgi:hypothetical protein